MALTADAKEELSHLEVNRPSARKAEASAMLRFAGGLHLVGGQVVVEAELDHGGDEHESHEGCEGAVLLGPEEPRGEQGEAVGAEVHDAHADRDHAAPGEPGRQTGASGHHPPSL